MTYTLIMPLNTYKAADQSTQPSIPRLVSIRPCIPSDVIRWPDISLRLSVVAAGLACAGVIQKWLTSWLVYS